MSAPSSSTPVNRWLRRLAGAGALFLTFGVVGMLALPRRRTRLAEAARSCARCRRSQRRRGRAFGVYAGACLALIVVRLALLVEQPQPCQPEAKATAVETAEFEAAPPVSADRLLRAVTVSVPAGAGFVYSRAVSADTCAFRPQRLYVAHVVDGYTGRAAFSLGDFVLSHPVPELSPERVLDYESHEAEHAWQWSVFTAAAGPLAFPVSYLFDEAFFPRAYNHFERDAGLHDGRYSAPDRPPPARSALMLPAAGALLVLVAARRPIVRRWRSRRHGGDAACAFCGGARG